MFRDISSPKSQSNSPTALDPRRPSSDRTGFQAFKKLARQAACRPQRPPTISTNGKRASNLSGRYRKSRDGGFDPLQPPRFLRSGRSPKSDIYERGFYAAVGELTQPANSSLPGPIEIVRSSGRSRPHMRRSQIPIIGGHGRTDLLRRNQQPEPLIHCMRQLCSTP